MFSTQECTMSTFSCPHCHKTLKTKAALPLGKQVKCPSCGEVFRLTESPASIRPAKAAVSRPAPEVTSPRKRPAAIEAEADPPARRKKAKQKSSGGGLLFALSGVGGLVALLAVAGFVWPGFLLERKNGVVDKTLPAPGASRNDDGRPKGDPEQPAPDGDGLPIREIMTRLAKGPQSLGNSIGAGLKGDAPAWDLLQGQTKEYLSLAKSMAGQDPPRGSKESWANLTGSFVEAATALDQSVRGQDRDAAVAAHASLSSSCMSCHQEHRGGPKGPKGGFGPKGFGPKKGPPPPTF
jgi:phage FluMu protein Com